MGNSILDTIKDLISFYVKTNYEEYLINHNINKINDSDIHKVVLELYIDKKNHIKVFIKKSMKDLYKEKYPGDLIINNILFDIFTDDKLAINKLITEIKKYQGQYE